MEATNRQVVSNDCAPFRVGQAGMRQTESSIFRICATVADGEFEIHATPSNRSLGKVELGNTDREGHLNWKNRMGH